MTWKLVIGCNIAERVKGRREKEMSVCLGEERDI